MKVVGVISSPRYDGNTATLVKEALKGAKEEGADITEIFLSKYKVEFCKGCLKCMKDGICPIADDFEALKTQLYNADAIIWGSPTYGGAFNAVMKNFFERLGNFARFTSSLGGKYMAVISTASSSGAKKVARNMASMVSDGIFKRVYLSNILPILIHGQDIKSDPKILEKARQLGKTVCRDIKENKKYPFQNIFGRLINHFFVKPSLIQAIVTHKEDAMKAIYNNLRERKLI